MNQVLYGILADAGERFSHKVTMPGPMLLLNLNVLNLLGSQNNYPWQFPQFYYICPYLFHFTSFVSIFIMTVFWISVL